MRAHATALLYENVVFSKSTPTWACLELGAGMLSATIPELTHIRELSFPPSAEKGNAVTYDDISVWLLGRSCCVPVKQGVVYGRNRIAL